MSKKELDYIVHQIQQARKETASTIAVQPERSRSIKVPKKLFSVQPWIIGVVLGVLLTLAALFVWHNPFQKSATFKSGSVVESIQKLSTLATAQERVKTILSKEDNKLFGKTISFDFPGSKRTLFLVVPGEVTAGVNLKDLTQKDVTLDEQTKTIHITLPHATIVEDPSIDSKHIQTFSDQGIFRSGVNWDEGFKLEDLAKQRIKKEAINSGLLKTAEDNARIALKNFFINLGYKVTISFK